MSSTTDLTTPITDSINNLTTPRTDSTTGLRSEYSDDYSQVTTDKLKYVLLPELKTDKPFMKFIFVIIAYTIILISYIFTAIYYDSYTPFTGNIFESPVEAQRRYKNYINDIVMNSSESFTVNTEEMKENSNIFDKLRNYINRFITSIFYVKGNTVTLRT